MQAIQPLSVSPLPPQAVHAPNDLSAGSAGGPSFEDMLASSLEQLNAGRQQAAGATENVSAAGGANLTAALGAIEQAGSASRTVMQVGDRLLAAYDEIKDLRM